jgi:hypothetical protein
MKRNLLQAKPAKLGKRQVSINSQTPGSQSKYRKYLNDDKLSRLVWARPPKVKTYV